MSHPNANENWPPRSPRDVLLSTPGGRDRLRRLAERTSPSPSPTKRPTSTRSIRIQGKESLEPAIDLGDSDEEDEETLQLKLQEIQARLKLKAIQKKTKQNADAGGDIARVDSSSLARSNSVAASRAQPRISGLREEQLQRSKSQTDIHVPVSPVRRANPAELPRSPQRVILGIDKGVRASEVSLRRAPSAKKRQDPDLLEAKLTGPFLQRPVSQFSTRPSATTPTPGDSRPKSFSERLAATRAQENERQERALRAKETRSRTFDIDHEKLRHFKETAVELPSVPQKAPDFSRDEVLSSYNSRNRSAAPSRATPGLAPRTDSIKHPGDTASISSGTNLRRAASNRTAKKVQPADVSEAEASQFEPYSSTHLSKRIVPHGELTRIVSGKTTFVLPDLLRIVKAPEFSMPDIDGDLVVFAIIASKSEPRSHQQNSKNDNRGKYMIFELTDLKWELSLFLFDSAFDKFWKLTPGTIIAILNPVIMPPPRGKADSGKFSLLLNSDEDTILEIGSARDLGFCKSVKKDGKTCDAWVDKRHTEFCDFHVNLTLDKARSGRMEVSSMNFGKGAYGARKYNSVDMTGVLDRRQEAERSKKTRYDVESHSHIYIGKRTAASLLDDTDHHPDAFHRGSTKEERLRRRLVADEKERELAKKLGALGTGIGADYLRKKNAMPLPNPGYNENTVPEPPPDAATLGLLGGKAKDVQLSPIKRKRTNTTSSSAPMGWGGNLTKELGRMKNGESLQPVRKKTRFVTEKGIREAGRESLGGDVVKEVAAASQHDNDDDDDDLDIVRE